jgi:GAF domain-containing protein
MREIEKFIREREKLNESTLEFSNKTIKRFYNIDSTCFEAGAISKKTKELMGLCASMVLRCDDCITYHLLEVHKAGATDKEVSETFSISLVIGGSVVIPHLRKAVKNWNHIKNMQVIEPKEKNKETKPSYRDNLAPKKKYQEIEEQIMKIISSKEPLTIKLLLVCKKLLDEVPHYHWVGFYLVKKPGILTLGPYMGEKTEHTEIPFGSGVCGESASQEKTIVIPDVSTIKNYLSCNIAVKSEIVVPIFSKRGKYVAQIDIDSHDIDAFKPRDVEFLENICKLLSKLYK